MESNKPAEVTAAPSAQPAVPPAPLGQTKPTPPSQSDKKQTLILLIVAWVSTALIIPSGFFTFYLGPIFFGALAIVIALMKVKGGIYKKNFKAIIWVVIAELVLGAVAFVTLIFLYFLTCTGSC